MNTAGKQKKEMLFLSTQYPHDLMIRIRRLLREEQKDESWLLKDEFLTVFSTRYKEFASEAERIRIAAEQGVIQGFYEQKDAVLWKQRVHLQKSLLGLVKVMKEYEAVELIETFMYIFDWKLEMKVERKWETAEEDKIEVHTELMSGQGNKKKNSEQKKKEVNQKGKPDTYIVVHRGKEPEGKKKETLKGKDSVLGRRLDKMSRQKKKMQGSGMLAENSKKGTSKDFERHEVSTHGFYGQDVKGNLKGKNKDEIFEVLKYALSVLVSEDNVSDVEYAKQLREMEFKHERLMSLSVRKEAHRAKRGDSRAQYAMGEFYAEENTGHTDYFEAAKWYSFAARQGNYKAKMELGKIFDSEKLLEDVTAEVLLDGRVQALSTKQYGIRYFKELAEEGYPTAQSILGMKYYFGDGVEKDTAKGISWLKKAAEQGHMEAQRQLGELYANIDEKESQKYFRMASAAGDNWSKSKLTK